MRAFRLLLICFFLHIVTEGYGQPIEVDQELVDDYMNKLKTEYDYLEPVGSYFTFPKYKVTNYQKIKSLLLDDLGSRPIARMLVLPSFEPEFVISVDQQGETYYITYIAANKSIWSSENLNEITAKKEQKQLSCDLAEGLRRLYDQAINLTRYTSGSGIGVDGTNYYFTNYSKFGARTGTKWSPVEGSKIFEMVELTESLIQQKAINETEITDKVNDLINRFLND